MTRRLTGDLSTIDFSGVIDAKQLERHFTNDELAQLYRFEPDDDSDPLDQYDADCVQDKILRNLMDQFSELIVSYREHDSLLIHRDEENLTEEEQRQAQDEGNFSPRSPSWTKTKRRASFRSSGKKTDLRATESTGDQSHG